MVRSNPRRTDSPVRKEMQRQYGYNIARSCTTIKIYENVLEELKQITDRSKNEGFYILESEVTAAIAACNTVK